MARITVEEPMPEEVEPFVEEEVVSSPLSAVTEPLSPPPSVETEHHEEVAPMLPRRKLPSTTVIIVAVAVLIIAIVMLVLLNDRNSLKKEVGTLRNAGEVKSAIDSQEAEQLKAEIGQFLELPADETPTLATVSDASKVKGQSFFINAQNGDKVLLFSKAGKAILYRPSTRKIIEVAPINLNNTQQPGNTTPTPPVAPPAGNTNRR